MPFEVADCVDPGDGNRRREHPGKSFAGEVLKKKLQLNKKIVPPPAIQGSLRPEFSLLENQPEGEEGWDEEEENYITNNVPIQRSSNSLNAPNRNASSFVSTSNQTSRASTTLSVPGLITAIEELLSCSPNLKPYIRYKLPLERKANGYFEFPISPIFYKDSCEICLDHGEICTVDRGESTSKCVACTRLGGKCIFVNLEGIAPRKGETHLNCGRCALGLGQQDQPSFTKIKQPFSPSKFLELNNQVPGGNPTKDMKQGLDEGLRAEKWPGCSTKLDAFQRTIQPNGDMVWKSPTRNGTNPISSDFTCSKSPLEASLAARSTISISYSSDQSVDTSSSSSTQELTSESDTILHPLFLQATTTTPASTAIRESTPESITLPASQEELAGVRRRRRRNRRQRKSPPKYPAKRTATESTSSNTNRLESLFIRPRTRLFEPETSRISPPNNEAPQAWLQWRGPVEEVPYEPAKPLFSEKSLRERQLELIKTTEKVYIPREDHRPDMREAREQLRYGFMERQGGELLARREMLNNEENLDEEVDEELTTEQYWERRLEEEHKFVQGSYWEYEPRRHR